jgi:CxxC motif-containing protein
VKRLMTCIACPQGCRLEVEADGSRVLSLTGHKCPRGDKYARQEVEAPMRTLTTSVLTRGLELKMLPVRTSGPIPKGKLFEAMDAVKLIVVTSPVKAGGVVAQNFLGLGVDLLAARTLGKAEEAR